MWLQKDSDIVSEDSIVEKTIEKLAQISATLNIPFKVNNLGAIHLWRPQKITFFKISYPIPPVHMRPHGPDPPTPLVDVHTRRHEIHTALLKWLVHTMTYRT